MDRMKLPSGVTVPTELAPFTLGESEVSGVITIKEESLEEVCALLMLRGCELEEIDPPRVTGLDGEIVLIHDWLWLADYNNL